jgi:hypothetical protein
MTIFIGGMFTIPLKVWQKWHCFNDINIIMLLLLMHLQYCGYY